ncbi:ROK family protein [Streptomyces sp. WMMC500]|uniref:ROK family protein n=1 Tax=Streptomyces sp. WMMC500 TaxID=3015154 RepID=UPI00248A9872|nr:ROK family protein [Streptomyces sp. WMMC500]WBB62448.1 ROK family protein [Streptomyces sp. WMMC500]
MTLAGGDSSLLRRLNAAAVLRALYETRSATLTELVKVTGSARATVENALTGLVGQGWAAEIAPATDGVRTVGRPAKRYRFRAEAGCVLGFDIGVHKALAVVADLRGEVLGVRRTAVTPELTPAQRLAATRALGNRALRGAGLSAGEVQAVGVGTTGIVDSGGRVAISGRLPNWAGTDLATALAEAFGAEVSAGNDARLAALAEHWRGIAADARNVVYVHAGRRIAAALLIDGRPYAGEHGAAGEIGVLASSRWDTAPGRLLERFGDAEALFGAVREEDPKAQAALEKFADEMVQGVAALVLITDPQLVAVGGGLSRAGDLLTEPLRRRLADLCLFPVPVAASTLGDEAVALGGVRLALDAVERRLFEVAG